MRGVNCGCEKLKPAGFPPLTDALSGVISAVILSHAVADPPRCHGSVDGDRAGASRVSSVFARYCQLEIAVEGLAAAQ
jgi:hypothetical protein